MEKQFVFTDRNGNDVHVGDSVYFEAFDATGIVEQEDGEFYLHEYKVLDHVADIVKL